MQRMPLMEQGGLSSSSSFVSTKTRIPLRNAKSSFQRLDELEADGVTATSSGVKADVAARMAAPRLTRLCEFEDKQLEEEYKSYEARHVLESRTAHIAVATALMTSVIAAIYWAVGVDDPLLLAITLVYAICWLTYAGYARHSALRGVPLARIEHVFVGLYVVSHITFIMRPTPSSTSVTALSSRALARSG
ncbi:hypothetical protein T492DRAFT_66656 [Pavlovales sp. CCMP2436]|nr:hypothetical protein T492DRAFT_66656 [Pavlovales sp. CCMP2436]